MAKVTFYLKRPNEKTETLILVAIMFYDQKLQFSTRESIFPSKWDFKKHRPKLSSNDSIPERISNKLDNIEKRFLKTFNDHLNSNNGMILQSKLREELLPIVRPIVVPDLKRRSLVEIGEEYVRICNKRTWTKKHYSTTIGILKKFQADLKKTFYPEDIQMEFYYAFVKWLENNDYAKNTIGSHIKEIKVFMTYANDKNYTQCTGHLNKRFKVIEETSDSIYLTEEEIMKIYNLDLKEEYQINIRDAFVIDCYTGLRYADLTQISPDKFTDNSTKISILTKKTGKKVVIPLHWTIKKIMERRKGVFPEIYSDQFMNREIKLLAEKAKITDLISKSITQGGKRKQTIYKKCQLVTVHTARRSFATNTFLAGIPTLSIMMITGHSSEKSFLKYIKVDSEQNADLVQSHKFFTSD